MTLEQILIGAILLATVAMFIWGRWRHDMVALASLLTCVTAGLIPAAEAFAGFGHPAVVTVAAVLVLSSGLQNTGAVDLLVERVLPLAYGQTVGVTALMGLGAFLSAFMNNVGAMALLMPVAVTLAARYELPPGRVLMPLAFGTILGGMTTLIGTPPNLIVSGFRAELGGGGFGMFDFSPVGAGVALLGIVFIALVGWRLVPVRKASDISSFDTGAYLTEARVTEVSKVRGKSVREAEEMLGDADAQILGIVKNQVRVDAPRPGRVLRRGDIVVIEAEPDALSTALSSLGLRLEEDVKPEEAAADEDEGDAERAGGEDAAADNDAAQPEGEEQVEAEDEVADSSDVILQELVVMPNSPLQNRSASDVLLRTRFSLNLLAISRQGRRSIKRLRVTQILPGDVLLMQGSAEAIAAFSSDYQCVPLAQRAVRIPELGRIGRAVGIMVLAVAGAAFGLLPAAISFVAAVLAFLALRIVPPRNAYDAVDWPVIVLLAALIPVAGAMATTGTADLIAWGLLEGIAQGHPLLGLALILVVTMTLSDFMNNAATAAVMCPVAISTAAQLGVNPDTFLMAVAIGASCAFLTPIGHQNNTLILGPGGFHFGDYWRLGLPMEILVVSVSLPLLLTVWPL